MKSLQYTGQYIVQVVEVNESVTEIMKIG